MALDPRAASVQREASRLIKEAIDEICEDQLSFDGDGDTTPKDIWAILESTSSHLLFQAGSDLIRAACMRLIERRLKALMSGNSGDHQYDLPGIPPRLAERIGGVITVQDDEGAIRYRRLNHPSTTVGHVRSHEQILDRNRLAIMDRQAAVQDLLRRCQEYDDDCPLVTIFAPTVVT